MKKIGISVYPSNSILEDDILYITKAAELGFSKLFISLLELEGNSSIILNKFKKTISHARNLNFEVILDINPSIFSQLNISYSDLSFFNSLGATGIRLDLGFSGVEEAAMTHNPFDLQIEINMSHGTDYVDNIMTRQPRSGFLIGSHNFYPHEYTGLDYSFFEDCSKKFKQYNISTSAFITSQFGQIGPWPIQEGLCSLEEHRFLPIEVQAAHLLFSNLIDCVVIGNAYASDWELKQLANVARCNSIPIQIEFCSTHTEIEKEIILNNSHIYRGEVNSYVFRTKSDGRKKYSNSPIPPNNTIEIMPGDVTIDNELYMQYKGELQIAKTIRKSNEKVNVVGRIPKTNSCILRNLQPWSTFHFEELII